MFAPPFGGAFCLRLVSLDHGLGIQAARPLPGVCSRAGGLAAAAGAAWSWAVWLLPPSFAAVRIVNGKRADTAMRLARYDLEVAQREYGDRIDREVKVLANS